MLKGSCLCREVQFEVHGKLSGTLNCHCTMCRKAQGSAFRSRARVNVCDFRFVSGADSITYYESSPGTHRGFCRICGSPILSKFVEYPDFYGLPLGTLDDDPQVRPKFHVFVANKAPWHEITDSLPRFDALPP